jgi:hypothetical protein
MSSDSPKRNDIIIVSGLPRSGTSMMMKMLAAGGVPVLTDAIRRADDDNPEGYFEFERAKQLDKGDTAWLDEARGKAVKVISALLPHLPDTYVYRVIFMERDIAEVLASQRKMLERRAASNTVSDEKMAAAFRKHLDRIRAELAQRPNCAVLYIQYRDVLDKAADQALRVQTFLGQALALNQMASAVKAQLYRNRGQ